MTEIDGKTVVTTIRRPDDLSRQLLRTVKLEEKPQKSQYVLVGTIIAFHSEKSAETKSPHSIDCKDESNVPDCSS